MTALRKGLATVATAAPVLAATGAAPALAVTDAHGGHTPQVIPCCGGSGDYVTWQSTRAGTYLEIEHAGLANGDDIDVDKKNGSCEYHGVTDTNCNEEWDQISMGGATHNGYDEFAYVNVNSGLCLAGGSEGLGDAVYQYSCGDYPTTRRYIYPNSSAKTGDYELLYTLENVANNLFACKEAGGAIVDFYNGASVINDYIFPSNGVDCWWQ